MSLLGNDEVLQEVMSNRGNSVIHFMGKGVHKTENEWNSGTTVILGAGNIEN